MTDSTILGGATMRAYVADWSKLGTGEKPWTPIDGEIVDALDVADLESEETHDYELLGAREGEEIAHEGIAPDGATVVDGGRTRRSVERFLAFLPQGVPVRGIVRLDGRAGHPRRRHRQPATCGDVRARRRRGLDGAELRSSAQQRPRTVEHRAPRQRRNDRDVPLLVRRRAGPLITPG